MGELRVGPGKSFRSGQRMKQPGLEMADRGGREKLMRARLRLGAPARASRSLLKSTIRVWSVIPFMPSCGHRRTDYLARGSVSRVANAMSCSNQPQSREQQNQKHSRATH